MSRKLLSVLLAVLMVISSVSCLFTATTLTASAAGTNLLDATKGADWTSGWNGEVGKDIDGEIMIKAAYRSVYTKVSLEPDTEYTLNFSFGQTRVGDVRVIPASEITDPATQLKVQNPDGGIAAPDATNLATGTFTAELTSGTPVDGKFYSASKNFKTNSEKEYYIILDCKQASPNSKNNVVLKDLKIEESAVDPNVLNDEAMSGLTWKSIWSDGLRNPVASVLDKSDSYSGKAFAMNWNGNARYRDNYTIVTLEPYTTYDFSFSYKSGAGKEYVTEIGFVGTSKVDLSAIKGEYIKAHLKQSTTYILGKKEAVNGKVTDGSWNNVSTTFTTGSDTEYVMYLQVTLSGSYDALTLSDFNLAAKEQTPTETLLNPTAWNSTWRLQGTDVSFTSVQDGISCSKSNYRDSFNVVKLAPNTNYDLSFKYKGASTLSNVIVYTASSIDLEGYYADNAKYPENLSALSGAVKVMATYTQNLGTYDGATENAFSFNFTTNEDEYYYIVLNHTAESGYTITDINLEVNTNVLSNTTASAWTSSWGPAVATTSNGCISVRAAYRSAYTKVTLEANTRYSLSFDLGEVRVTDIRVYDAAEITDLNTQMVSGKDGGAVTGGTTNLAKDAIDTNCPATPEAGQFYTATESFTTTSATEYYIILDCGAFSTTSLLLKNIKLIPKKAINDSNVLNDYAMEGLSWKAIWNTGLRNPVASVLDKSNSYSGKAYAMNWNVEARYRDNYTTVTLEPNTTYNFSFYFKSSATGQEIVNGLGFVDASKVDFSTYKGDTVKAHLTDASTPILGKDNAVLGTATDGTWNKAETTFTTTDATEYVMYLYSTLYSSSFTALTLSDFSLEAVKNVDDLTDTIASDWTSSWTGDSGTYENVIAVKNAYHSAYTKVTLDAYNDYTFTFNAAWTKTSNVRVYAASEITDAATQLKNSDAAVTGGTNNLVSSFTTTQPDTGYTNASIDVLSTYYTVTAKFRTLKAGEYYVIIDGGEFNGQNLHPLTYNTYTQIKNISLVGTPFEVDAENVLNDVVMPTLTWKSIWSDGLRNHVASVLDKSNSYSGKAFAMSWNGNSRFHDTFTTVTLEPHTTYSLSFYYLSGQYQERVDSLGFVDASMVDFATYKGDTVKDHLKDASTPVLGKENLKIENNNDGVSWSKVSTTFTTTEATEYVMYLYVTYWDDYNAETGKPNNAFSGITLSDFDLREWEDPNKLANATVANGDVRWSVGKDIASDYITTDQTTTYTNSAGEEITRSRVYYYDEKSPSYTYYGGYTWRIILGGSVASEHPAVFGYISAKGLEANTKYTFSYVYTDTYHVKLADIYNNNGSLDISDVTTKMLPTKQDSTVHHYIVTVNFTTGDEGDYTIKLQTGRSKNYYIYDASSWALTAGDLSLMEYVEAEIPDVPANALEDYKAKDWNSTWYEITDTTDGFNGAPAISTSGIHYHALYTRVDLKPNTEYTLSFNYKSRAVIDCLGVVESQNVQLANIGERFSGAVLNGKGSIVYYYNTEKLDDDWSKVTAKFVTSDNTSYYIYFENASGLTPNATGDATVISNMDLAEADVNNASKVDYDFENGTIGAISTTSASDKPSVAEENGNKYLKFTKVNDGITVPFYYNTNNRYVVSFDMKVLSYPSNNSLEMTFKTSADNNNGQYKDGGVFSYRNDAYSIVSKDLNGNLLTAPAGFNYSGNSQLNGFKQMFSSDSGNDWIHYEITLNPEYTYYSGLMWFGFDSGVADWSIALDNIKVKALDAEVEDNALENYEPTKYAAIRQKTVDAKQGIRVKSSIDASLLTANNGFKVVEYGTLAINSQKLGEDELVYDMVNNSRYNAKIGVAYNEKSGTNAVYEQKDDVITFTGVLIGLKDFVTDYTVRGYMIVESADGEQFVIYEDEGKTVSVYDVVYAILNDGVTNDDDTVANEIVSRNEAKYNTWVDENIPVEEEITASKTVNLTVSNAASPVSNNYRGFSGTIYHAFGFMEDDATGRIYTEEMRNKELDRLEDAGIHYVRTRYQSQWIFDDATGYNWNSDRFNYFLNYAKALQERDIEVILQVGWHFDFVSQDGVHSIQENDYFNGEGEDLYGESNGVDFSGKSEEDIRIIKAARRYGYMMAKTLQYAKANGVNNIKYFSYFVEPSNSYSAETDNLLDRIEMSAGHDKEEYLLFCQTMIKMLKTEYGVTDVKNMGPNEAGYSKLINYILEKDPGLFDILTAHNYPDEGDVKTNYDKYYDTMTNNSNHSTLNGYMTDFNDYKGFLATAQEANPNAEFWADEFNIKDFETGEGRGTSSFYRGLATAMGGIVAQQSGIQNTILWMSFDQLWTDKTGGDANTKSEFMNGIHQCGNAPSLFISDDPYAQYYPTSLFSKYNGYKNGTVYKTNLTETETEGVYVGAVRLEDGSWTVSVLNMNTTAVNINVAFDTAINQTLYRHIVSADKADTYKNAELPDADKTFTGVGTTFSDVLPAGSFAVYTGVQG